MFCCLLSAAVWQKPHLFTASLPPLNGMPPKVSMPVVNQITRSPGLLNFNRFSPHAFHLDKKVEVFAAEGSPNHVSPGQLKFSRFSAPNHQFTLANQAYTTPHHRGGGGYHWVWEGAPETWPIYGLEKHGSEIVTRGQIVISDHSSISLKELEFMQT